MEKSEEDLNTYDFDLNNFSLINKIISKMCNCIKFLHDNGISHHDIKLENYELTSGYRKDKLKQRVYLWNPADPEGVSHCYNPIDFVSRKMGQMVDDVQKISNLLYYNWSVNIQISYLL